MDDDNRLGVFLRARRELVQPEEVGLPSTGRRRVPGLRREELAMLAGVSADYYVRLEQGRDRHPSEQVLESLARVLQLDEAAAAHLHELARPAPRRRRARRRAERVSPSLVRLLESWSSTPAFVLSPCLDVLAHNALAGVLHGNLSRDTNLVRRLFLDPASRDRYPDWVKVAEETVASLRASSGADLDDPRLTDLVGELSLKSDEFRRLWARHDVREKASGRKRFVHPMVGELELSYETFTVNGTAGQTLSLYHAEPGSDSERALTLLAGIAAGEAAPATGSRR